MVFVSRKTSSIAGGASKKTGVGRQNQESRNPICLPLTAHLISALDRESARGNHMEYPAGKEESGQAGKASVVQIIQQGLTRKYILLAGMALCFVLARELRLGASPVQA